MTKWMAGVALVTTAGAGYFALRRGGHEDTTAGGAPKAGAFAQPPMTVELTNVSRAPVQEYVEVVGSLVGAATVDVVPRAQGRLQSIDVRIGDPVTRGQVLAKVEDQELREQLRQADASFEVARATIRQREADLTFARTNLDRPRAAHTRRRAGLPARHRRGP